MQKPQLQSVAKRKLPIVRPKKREDLTIQKKFQKQEKLLSALGEISGALASEIDLQRILTEIATIVAKQVKAKWVNFWELTSDKKAVYIVAYYGMESEYMEQSRQHPIPLGTAWIGRAVKTGKPWATSDILTDPRLKEIHPSWAGAVKKQDYHGLLCLPLLSRKATIGGMCVYYPKVHEFTDFEMRLFTVVANQAATAISNTKIFNELEAAKTALEVKVEARTKEFKELAEGLEEKVKERTKELQAKLNELERYRRLTVGRELKMVALKKEIEILKKELEKPST